MKCRFFSMLVVLLVVGMAHLAPAAAEEGANTGSALEAETDTSVNPTHPGSADGADLEEGPRSLDASAGPAGQILNGEGAAKEVFGPGGKPLRTDYPGTEASLQQRMATDRIEGLDFGEGVQSGEGYDLRIRELETKIDDLKERVFRSKSRIVLLKETVLSGNLAGSRAVVVYETKLGQAYRLRRAFFSIDGNRIFNRLDRDGDLAKAKRFEVYSGTITPGTHTVSINLGFQGSGYGVFRYAEGYEFNLRSSCQFTAEEGKTSLITVTSYEQGNVFTAHEDRPFVGCQVRLIDLRRDELEDMSAGSVQ